MGAFDDLVPTKGATGQAAVTQNSLNRKVENTPETFEQKAGLETGTALTGEVLSFLGDIARTSEGVRTAGLRAIGSAGGPIQIGAKSERLKQLGSDITTSLGALLGSEERTPQIGDLLREQGVSEPLAQVGGLAGEILTDPLTFLGGGIISKAGKGAKAGEVAAKELAPELAQRAVKESAESTKNLFRNADFDLTARKTFDDFEKEITAKQNRLLEIDKDPLFNEEAKLAAKKEVAQELEDTKYNQVINEMSDFDNNLTKRTILPNPNPLTSLVQTYISNKGQFGGALYRQMEKASNVMDGLRANWLTAFDSRGNLPKVFGSLNKNQRQNFFATMEGFEEASDPVIKSLVDIAKKNRTDIADGAIKRGVQIKDANSSTGKFFSIRENHMPHQVINPKQVLSDPQVVKDSLEYSVRIGRFKNMAQAHNVYEAYADAVKKNVEGLDLLVNDQNKPFFDWMVKSGQAEDIPDAVKRFKYTQKEIKTPSAGSIESQRIVDIPFYDVAPERVLSRYYSSVSKRFGEIDTLGRNNEIANKLVEGIKSEFGDKDAERVTNMVNLMTGSAKPSQLGETTAQILRDVEAARKLSLAVFMNLTQTSNTAAVTGIMNTNKALLQAISKEGRDYAYKAGVLFSEAARSMYGVSDDLVTGKMVTGILNATGFTEIERMNRITAALAAKHFANEQALKFIASNGTNKTAGRALQNMGLHPDSILKRGSIADNELLDASKSIVNRTQFRSRVLDSPEWAASPWGKLFNQFKNYSENQVKFLREEVLNEAKQGNYGPMMRYLTIAPSAYAAAKTVKSVVQGKDPRKDTRTALQKGAEIAANMGMFGMYYDILQSVNFKGQGWVSALVPALDTLGQGGSAAFEAVRPLGQRLLGEEEAQYLNLRPATKFIAKSVPVVGGRLVEALKTPEDKQREASRLIREATERGLDVNRLIGALSEDKDVNVTKALKGARGSIKRKRRTAAKTRVEGQGNIGKLLGF